MSQAALKTNPSNTLVSTNPAQGYEVLGQVDISSTNDIQDKVNAVRKVLTKSRKLKLFHI